MSHSKINIEDLKSEFLYKGFGFLVVTDIVKENIYKCICKCRCGKETKVDIYKLRSGHTSSCGCYSKSKEFSDKQRQFILEHPEIINSSVDKYKQWRATCLDEVTAANEKHRQWFKNNPDAVAKQADNYSKWCKDNPDIIQDKTRKYLEWCSNNPKLLSEKGARHSQWYKEHYNEIVDRNFLELYKDSIHPDDYITALNSTIDLIRTKCPICGNYSSHRFYSVFSISKQSLLNDRLPLCKDCFKSFYTSHPENDILDFISTFYNEQPIRNSRSIIAPLELDLYYPTKQTAIEFNGDYWHSTIFKDSSYHLNKYLECCKKNIHLINIFENDWNNNRDNIKNILRDTFTNSDKQCIFNRNEIHLDCDFYNINDYINNGYAVKQIDESYYTSKKFKVYRTGIAHLVKL